MLATSRFLAPDFIPIGQLDLLIYVIDHPIIELHEGVHFLPLLFLSSVQTCGAVLGDLHCAELLVEYGAGLCGEDSNKLVIGAFELIGLNVG